MKVIRNAADAVSSYWAAKSQAEETAAYNSMLLFGVPDGYPGPSKWRANLARVLRRLAIRIEGTDKWGKPLPLCE